jgi:serine protease Do
VAEWFGLKDKQGVLVTEVKEGSAADKGGIKRDDVVIEFDGQPVTEVGSFRSRVASTEPGRKINLVLMRNGERVETTVEVGKLDATAMSVNSATGAVKNLGVAVQNLSDELAERFGYKGDAGVVVTEVEPGSSAERAGIQPGSLIKEVNRQPIKNTQDFENALKESSGKKAILLLVRDGEMSRYVALQTP